MDDLCSADNLALFFFFNKFLKRYEKQTFQLKLLLDINVQIILKSG